MRNHYVIANANKLLLILLLSLTSCYSTNKCKSTFLKRSLENETILKNACSYLLANFDNAFKNERAMGLDSIKDTSLRRKLDDLNIGSIYIRSGTSDYLYPLDSTIAFSKSYVPFKTSRHEYVIFSFAQHPDTINYNKSKPNETICRVKEKLYYFSWW